MSHRRNVGVGLVNPNLSSTVQCGSLHVDRSMLEKASLIGKHTGFRVASLVSSPVSLTSKRRASIATAQQQQQQQQHPLRPIDNPSPQLPSPRHLRIGLTSPPTSNLIKPTVLHAIDELLNKPITQLETLNKLEASPALRRYFTDPELARQLAEVQASRHPGQLHRMLTLAHRLGCALKQSAYECVCHQLFSAREWNAILSIVRLGKDQSGRTTTRLLNWKARALMETHNYALLGTILQEFKDAHLRPTRRTYQIILGGYLRNRDLTNAKICMHEMEKSGYPADPSIHAIIVKHYRHLGADRHVQGRALEGLSSVSPGTAIIILNCSLQIQLDAEDWIAAYDLLSHFDPSFVALMAPIFTTNVFPVTTQYPPSLPTSSLRITPNATTFTIFMELMASRNNLDATLKIYMKMLSMGIKPTLSPISVLAQAYFAAGQGDVAVRILVEMCLSERCPITLFQDFTIGSLPDELVSSIKGIRPTTRIINVVLKGLLNTYGPQAATAILKIMRLNDLRPNATTLHVILDHLSSSENASPQTMLRALRKLTSRELRPTPRHLQIILNRLLRHQKYITWGAGWLTLASQTSYRKLMHHLPQSDRVSTTSSGINVIAGVGLPRISSSRSLITPLLRSLTSRNVQPDGATCALRIRHEAVLRGDMDAAKAVFDALLGRGIHPNRYHYSALIEGYSHTGDLRAAVDVMKAAESAGIQLNVVMFTMLINGYARQGNPDAALRTFQEMVRSGIQPDVPAIDAVASAFFAVGAYDMAKRVLVTLWTYIQPFPKELRGARLRDLVRAFRQLHPSQRNISLSPGRRISLRWHVWDLANHWSKVSIRPSLR